MLHGVEEGTGAGSRADVGGPVTDVTDLIDLADLTVTDADGVRRVRPSGMMP